jgi:hypothetical protein
MKIVDLMRKAYNLDDQKTIAILLCSLEADALDWGYIFTSSYPNATFDEFKNAFIARFKLYKDTFAIKQELRTRTQGNNEKIGDYLRSIRSLCEKLNPAMTEAEKVEYAIEGLADKYLHLVGNPKTLADLESTVSTLQSREYMKSTRKSENLEYYLEDALTELKKEISSLIASSKEPQPVSYNVNPIDIAEAVGEVIEKQLSSALARISEFAASFFAQLTWHQQPSTSRYRRRNYADQDNVICSYCGKIGHCELRCRTKKYHRRQNSTHYFDYKNTQTDKQPQFICFNQPVSATPNSFPAVTTLRDGLDENVHTSAAESVPACDEERAKILHSVRTPKEAIVNTNMPISQEAPSSESRFVVTVEGSIFQPESDYFAKIAEINELMKDALIVTTKDSNQTCTEATVWSPPNVECLRNPSQRKCRHDSYLKLTTSAKSTPNILTIL